LATITLGTLAGYWQNVSDWVNGLYTPMVQLNPATINQDGSNNIGVNVENSPTVKISGSLPAGSAAIGTVGVTSLPGTPAQTADITTTLMGGKSLASVDTDIVTQLGTTGVKVTSIPSIPAGANTIGGVTTADGNVVTLGAKADAAVTTPASTASAIALIKGLLTQLQAAIPAGANTIGGVTNPNIEQTPGSAVPAKVVALGASNGTNIQALQVDSWKYLNVDVQALGGNAMSTGGMSDSLNQVNCNMPSASYTLIYDGGSMWDRLRYANIDHATNPSASGNNILWTPTSGKKFRLLGGFLIATAAVTVQFLDGGTQISPSIPLVANQVLDLSMLFSRSNGKLSSAANNLLYLNLSSAINVPTWVTGTEE
jgi:hypothetical protein